jgi:hypothetical protein
MVEITLPIVLQIVQTIALIVGITYYLFIMRNSQKNQELTRKSQEQAYETRQAQLFWNLLEKYTSKEGLEKLQILLDDTWSDHEEWLERYRNNAEYKTAFIWLKDTYEVIGVTLRLGYVDIKLMAYYDPRTSLYWWEKYRDIIYKERERRNNSRWHSEWEYSYNVLVQYLEEHPELKT